MKENELYHDSLNPPEVMKVDEIFIGVLEWINELPGRGIRSIGMH